MTPLQEWRAALPHLKSALTHAHEEMSIEDVWGAIADGRMHFWPAVDSAMVTELSNNGRDLHIRLFGGTLDRLREMLPSVEAFGRALGCQAITVLGRRGWERTAIAQERGYRPIATLLRKELPNELRIETEHHSEQHANHSD